MRVEWEALLYNNYNNINDSNDNRKDSDNNKEEGL